MSKLYCVYMHVSPEGLLYIGKTSRKPILRWTSGNKYLGNKDFYDAIIKYGERNFLTTFGHFYLAADRQTWLPWSRDLSQEQTNHFPSEEAEQLEKEWIGILDTMNPQKGFNRASGGDSDFSYSSVAKEHNREAHVGLYDGKNNPFYGQSHSDETKALLSDLAKQRTGENNPFYGKTHSEETKERNRQAHLGKYDGENNPFYGQRHSSETRDLISEQNSKPISMYTLDGLFVRTFPSALVAAKEMGVAVQSISMCATKATKTSCGMVWRYFKCALLPKDELPPKHASCKMIVQYTLSGELVRTFDSLTEAAKTLGVTLTAVSAAVNGKVKTCAGYVFKYVPT